MFLLLTSLTAVLLLSGCGLVSDDDDAEPTPVPVDDGSALNQGPIRVLDSAMSTEIDERIQASGIVANAFPTTVRRVHIVLVLEGVGPGTVITGRWYQLVNDGPPGGTELSSAGITLTDANIFDGAARVELNLSSGPDGFPIDDYVVRIYAGEEFIKTSAFVISRFVVHPAGGEGGATGSTGATGATGGTGSTGPTGAPEPTATTQQQAPAPTATQAPPAPTATQTSAPPAPTATPAQQGTPETYTVVAGDTLTIIAERFKSATESTESYVTRLQEANNLAPGAILTVGQVLTLPAP